MELEVRMARSEESDAVIRFYYDLIEAMESISEKDGKPGWQKGIYPSESFICESIERHTLWIGMKGGRIAAAMVLNQDCADAYGRVKWQVEAEPGEMAVIHAFGVAASCQRQGVARDMLSHIIRLCGQENRKAIRLDVLRRNYPAIRLYEAAGFVRVDMVKLFYEDTGLTEFYLYEYVL